MPITHHVLIDGQDVSPWVMAVRTDLAVPATNESFVQQLDLTLSNVGGKFDGAFGAVGIGTQSDIIVQLMSYEYSQDADEPTVYEELIFTGKAQKVDNGYLECKISAGDGTCNANGYIEWDIHKHKGQSTKPVIDDWLAMYNIRAGQIEIPDGMERREHLFLRDLDGKNIQDFVSNWDGNETYIDESGMLVHVRPLSQGTYPPYTGRMKLPQNSESAVGFCNKVIVRGGSFIDAKDPGAEHLPADAIGYETTLEDLAYIMANEYGEGGTEAAQSNFEMYGWIRAPTLFVPELTTNDQCKTRALRLLALYKTYLRRSMPAVVGRSPKLRWLVSYQYMRMIQEAWQTGADQGGRVLRCKTEYSSKAGWVSYIEVEPNPLSETLLSDIYGNTQDGE